MFVKTDSFNRFTSVMVENCVCSPEFITCFFLLRFFIQFPSRSQRFQVSKFFMIEIVVVVVVVVVECL